MDFTEYIKPELLILIPVLYVIGMAVKKTALIADKLIPLVVGAIGILLSVIYVLATTALGSPCNGYLYSTDTRCVGRRCKCICKSNF